jgi:hypothetical protein
VSHQNLVGWVLVTHAYNPSHLGGRDQEDCSSQPAWAKKKTLSQKGPTYKKGLGGGAQVIEHPPSMHEP